MAQSQTTERITQRRAVIVATVASHYFQQTYAESGAGDERMAQECLPRDVRPSLSREGRCRMRKTTISAVAVLVIINAGICVLGIANRAVAREFRVSDSIEMTLPTDPDIRQLVPGRNAINFSPDGSHYAIVLRRGDLRSGTNIYTLLVFRSSDVLAAISKGRRPDGRQLAIFRSASNRPGIARVKWLGKGEDLAFIGEDIREEGAQVYRVSLRDGKTRRVTSHPSAIIDFDITDSGHIVYLAEHSEEWTEKLARGYVIDDAQPLVDVMGEGRRVRWQRAAYFATDGRTTTAVDTPALHLVDGLQPDRVWIAPDGRLAVIAAYRAHPVDHWQQHYEPIKQSNFFGDDTRQFTTPHPYYFFQYALLNFATGQVSPLLDAPLNTSGLSSQVIWSNDSKRAFVLNTYLPLTGTSGEERVRRRHLSAIVDFDFMRRDFRVVHYLGNASDADAPKATTFVRAEVSRDGCLLVFQREDTAIQRIALRQKDNDWIECDHDPADERGYPLSIVVRQSLTQIPELEATNVLTGRSTIISDLNPQLRDVEFTRAETITWHDAGGKEWTGGLVWPTGYAAGRRYPLVIQTHGFDPETFLVDGPNYASSGFAARALAARGLFVLQAKEARYPSGTADEIFGRVSGYISAIQELNRRGLVDVDRIGIHAWSRTGFYLMHMLVFSHFPIAAASVSDGSAASIYQYVSQFGFNYPGMIQYERFFDAEPWGDKKYRWVERDPMFNLDRVRAPLRIEAYRNHPYIWWEANAILRRLNRPVEFVSIPDGAHSLVKPWHKLTSQTGVVDWFDFWLNGHEDRDSSKAEQYARWRELREQQKASLAQPLRPPEIPPAPTEPAH